MNYLADVFLQMYVQMRILHWQTKSYARHVAFGAFYDFLDDAMDRLIEEEMGKFGRVKTCGHLELHNIENCDMDALLKEFEKFLVSMTLHYTDHDDTNLLNIRDDILGEVKKLRFLLTLD